MDTFPNEKKKGLLHFHSADEFSHGLLEFWKASSVAALAIFVLKPIRRLYLAR